MLSRRWWMGCLLAAGCADEPLRMYRIGMFAEGPRCEGLAIRSDSTLFAACGGQVFAGKDDTFAVVPGQDPEVSIVNVWIRAADQAVFGHEPGDPSGRLGGYYELIDGAWQLHAPTDLESLIHSTAPFIVDEQDRVVAMYPRLQRFDPSSGVWTEIAAPTGVSNQYDEGLAIAPDGRVMVALTAGVAVIEDDGTLTLALDCQAAEPPEACEGNVGIATGPRLLRNGLDGDVYWVSGGTLYAPLMWRWNNGSPQRAVLPAENRFFTNYAVQRDGDVVLSERECNGCAVAELRRYTGVTESTALIDLLPDRNYYPFIGHDGQLVLWSPQGDTWLGLFRVE